MGVAPWRAGQRLEADRLNRSLPIFASWTPTWTTSTGTAVPSFGGDETITCEYAQMGDFVVAHFEIVFTAATDFGTDPDGADNWRFGLPPDAPAAQLQQSAGWMEINQSTSHRAVCRCRFTTLTQFELELSTGAPDGENTQAKGLIDGITPWNDPGPPVVGDWASGDAIRGVLTYESA